MDTPKRQFPLSPRQRELVDTIASMTNERGFPPTLREISAKLGVHFSRAATLAGYAERRGWLTHEPRVARSWRVLPEQAATKPTKPAKRCRRK